MRKGRLLSKVSRVLLAALMAGAMLSVVSEVVNATNYPSAQWVPADGSNYTPSNREGTYDITYIVIHVAEGSYQGTISWFQNPDSNVSAHYVVSKIGEITAMVRDEDVAWHAGNWDYNCHSIGIEHEGYASDPNSFTEAMYQASADLVRWLAQKYNIQTVHPSGVAPASPTSSTGIIGHNQVPDPDNPSQGGGINHHTDPGPYWNWDHYMQLVTQTSGEPSPTITSSLRITQSAPYYVGDTITAQFTIANKGAASITFDVLTAGGRDPDDQVADFDFHENVTLNPDESYGYQGSLTLAKAGSYHFFCAYYIANPTPEEKQLLDQNNWNTSVPTEAGVTNVMDITVNPAPNLPDLVIQNITWLPANPSVGDTVTFTVTIKNQGSGKSGYSYVYYYIDNAQQAYDSVSGVDPGATATETFTWSAKAGSHAIKAVADAKEQVTESNETNNEKKVTYSATALSDLIIEGITWLPANPSVGDTVTFTVTIKNQGSGKACYSYVYYYIDNAQQAYDSVSGIDPGATATETFTWSAKAGSHAIKAVADAKEQVTESNETNNEKTITFSATSLSDLVIDSITWKPSSPSVGDTVTFTVTVKNQGSGKAGSSYAYYYVDNAYKEADYVDPVDPGATATETFTWTAQAGSHTIKAVADCKEAVTESDETNNEKTITLSALAPDLIIVGITWSPAKPSKGDTVIFTVTIKNQGSGKASSSRVYFYIDDSKDYGEVNALDPGATATKTFKWTAEAGSHTIKAVADKLSWVTESNETNNEKMVIFSILLPLTPTPTPYPTPTPTPTPVPSPKPGEVSVYLYGQRTQVNVGEDIVLSLSAVNLITKPTMTVQLILKVPSGMSVTSTGFVKGGGGQYTASYSVEPGGIKQIEVHIMTNQEGNFNVIGDICYYFGGDKSTAKYQTISLPVTVRTAPPQKAAPSPTPKKGGGFSCSGPAQGAPPPSTEELLTSWGLIGLSWGSLGGCYGILRWRRRNRSNN